MTRSTENHSDVGELLDALPKSNDIELVILKGHLIAEQLLNKMIVEIAPNSKPLIDERIPFSILTKIGESLREESNISESHLWQPLQQLNKLRNIIAHQLTPTKLNSETKKMIAMYEKSGGWRPAEYRKGNDLDKLRFAIVGPLHFMAGAIQFLRDKK